jgi:shikimate kinase
MIVYLIGFMGSGKARYGKRLAKVLNFDFVDTDELIENREKQEITEIFKNKGEDYFRKLEAEVLTEVSQMNNTIVATGGGMPCRKGIMEFMNSTGLTIYFKAGLGCVMKNLLREKERRPMIANIDATVLADYIHEKLEERKPCYAGTHASIVTNNMKFETLLTLVKEKLKL